MQQCPGCCKTQHDCTDIFPESIFTLSFSLVLLFLQFLGKFGHKEKINREPLGMIKGWHQLIRCWTSVPVSFLGSGSRHLPHLSSQEIPKLEGLKTKLAQTYQTTEKHLKMQQKKIFSCIQVKSESGF